LNVHGKSVKHIGLKALTNKSDISEMRFLSHSRGSEIEMGKPAPANINILLCNRKQEQGQLRGGWPDLF